MRVRVRMYRQGLGDCYLLTFGTGNAAKHVLIDCGTLGSTTNQNTMKTIVEHIGDTTNRHLHLVVATHEHKDHLSGFASRDDDFRDMTIDRFWVAWTEKPTDSLAKELKVYANDLGLAAAAGIRAMRALAPGTPEEHETLIDRADSAEQVLGFFGDDAVFSANEFAPTIHAAMELIRNGYGNQEAEYLEPETLVDVSDWLPGFRVYVLGPPRSKTAIADTGEQGGGDLYPYPAAGVLAGARAAVDPASTSADAAVPFDVRYRIADADERAHPEFYTSYMDPAQAWRRVDADWLAFSSILALQLDNRTNNTSLVLAFERISDGKVLLFPADAQRGNWQSWSGPPELEWTVTQANGTQKTVKTTDLLARTVFYKVGHHSSHNATAREKGLEKMTHNSLVAFIPVDRQVAQAKGWNTMPTRALYKRLMEKCKGRVARSDIGWVTADVDADFTSMFTDAEWQTFATEQQKVQTAKKVQFDPLFVDYVLKS